MESQSNIPSCYTIHLAPDGGFGLDKTVLRSGAGPPAGNGSCVRLRYSMRLSGTSLEQSFDSSSTRSSGVLEFTVGKRRVIPAMELIAASMAIGEECEVVCAPKFAFGSAGLKRKNVPPNSTIAIRVEMVSFKGGVEEKPFAEMTASERFAKAELYKEQGNKLFKETKYEKAVSEYSTAIRLLANIFTQPMVHPEKSLTSNNHDMVPVGSSNPRNMQNDGTPGSNVDNVRAAPALKTDRDQSTEETQDGYQEANIVADEAISGKEVIDPYIENGGSPEVNGQSNSTEADTPSESQVVGLHVRTLNNLSLCCFKLGQHASAEEGATLAIRLDEKNFKGFYYR